VRRRIAATVALVARPLAWMVLERALGEGREAYAVGLWALVLIAATAGLMFVHCPRCKRPFHLTCGWFSPLSSECLHCGLPLVEPSRNE
jgi:hypothetical protein